MQSLRPLPAAADPSTAQTPDRRVRKPSKSQFLIRLRSWEYWPFGVVYLPVFIYWLWLSLKARSLFFFSASNPGIETGGLLGVSKAAILNRISAEFKPRTVVIPVGVSMPAVADLFEAASLSYPVMAKPDVGERGWRVEKIDDWAGLVNYARRSPCNFLLQEFVDFPLELGVLYYRSPNARTGVISSVVQKEFLTIQGNGRQSVAELIGQNERAVLQLPALRKKHGAQFARVLPAGEVLTLVGIGNHCRGTKFLNANHLISPELVRVFDRISRPIDGFYYGRFDLRCPSLADLQAGRHIKIMELNGAGAEPAHIYQPGFSLWQGWRVLLRHWTVLYQISRENHRQGVAYMSGVEAVAVWKRIQQIKKASPERAASES